MELSDMILNDKFYFDVILTHTSNKDYYNFSLVSKRWNELVKNSDY